MLNRDCWNSITIFSKVFVTLTSVKNMKWVPTLSTWLCWKKTRKTLTSLKYETGEMHYARENSQTFSLPTQQGNIFRKMCCNTHTQAKDKRQPCLFKVEYTRSEKLCYTVKRTVTIIDRATSTKSAAKDFKKTNFRRLWRQTNKKVSKSVA